MQKMLSYLGYLFVWWENDHVKNIECPKNNMPLNKRMPNAFGMNEREENESKAMLHF